MKIKASASMFVLFLLGLAAGQPAAAQSARGTYQFSLDDGYTKYVEFSAETQADGTATGKMMVSDEAPVYTIDVDGNGESEDKYPGFFMNVDFDGMAVNNNLAVMSGKVTDSSIRSLIGERVLFTVEDNGDNSKEPDKLAWGVYKPTDRNWTPSDSEWRDDPGVGLRWLATDAEVKEDEGIPMPKDESITTKTFPGSSYAFFDVQRAAGDIVVQP